MLTAELVRATRRNGRLVIKPLEGSVRERALQLASAYLAIASDHQGLSRGELLEAWSSVRLGPRDKRLADGLRKLIEDRCHFAADEQLDPRGLRSEVFLRAAEQRRADPATHDATGLPAARFNREEVLAWAASEHQVPAPAVDAALYADLKSAQLLLHFDATSAQALVEHYDLAQVQAVLLRATRVTARLRCAQPAAYRDLFRHLKFRRLLCTIERDADAYRLVIEGPYSLFESVTKYGLQLALLLPSLLASDELQLSAALRWGPNREPLTFELEHRASTTASSRRAALPGGRALDPAATEARPGERASTDARASDLALPDDVRELLDAFAGTDLGWRARVADAILDLPGIGVCVPDLAFEQEGTGREVLLEVLGYWSREAVWRRVELVQAGLATPVVFAASSRLRVSEAVLDDAAHGALYVYKGKMSPRAVARKLAEALGQAPRLTR